MHGVFLQLICELHFGFGCFFSVRHFKKWVNPIQRGLTYVYIIQFLTDAQLLPSCTPDVQNHNKLASCEMGTSVGNYG